MAEFDCSSCAGAQARREFLRNAFALAVGATALRVDVVSALRSTATTLSYPVPTQDGAFIDKDEDVILVRWQNSVYAFALSCPHQNTALRWRAKDQRFQCPKHKSKYQPDGTFISGRATRGMDRFAIKREQNMIVVDKAQLFKQPENRAAWDAAFIRLEA